MLKKILAILAIINTILMFCGAYDWIVFEGLVVVLVAIGFIFPIKIKKESVKQ